VVLPEIICGLMLLQADNYWEIHLLLFLPAVQSNTTVYVQSYSVGLDTCWSERVPVPVAVIPVDIDLLKQDTVICEGVSIVLPWGELVQPTANDSFAHTWTSAVTGCDSLTLTVHVNVLDLQSIELAR
jgi:hypothetical protein